MTSRAPALSLHFRCPILFNAIGGVMPQEALTVKFFNHGAGVELIKNAADFSRIMQDWLADRSRYERFRNDFLKLRYEEDPTLVINELVDLAQEVAHTNLRPGPFPCSPTRAAVSVPLPPLWAPPLPPTNRREVNWPAARCSDCPA